ncbi:hypothetical protein Patl1_11594 [Pistacia atlantica]|uniref:Uncharacterized protein n=1 Tax=Pistacia atlantica TaxID=434234 RepID=A0ACC1A8B0_9ROSI|nr:hypothetical protein Patl1_11594 [Pistacia atlantica]
MTVLSLTLPACSALEDADPDDAIQLYTDACDILEEDGKEQMAFDLYRATANVYIKLEKYTDAAAFLLRLGLAADKCKATNSQCKVLTYIIWLSTFISHSFQLHILVPLLCIFMLMTSSKQRSATNDCSQDAHCLHVKINLLPGIGGWLPAVEPSISRIDAFLRSDQSRCASKLLSAYREGDVEEIKRVAHSSTISNLDNTFRSSSLHESCLPEKLTVLKTDDGKDEEALDENDLT